MAGIYFHIPYCKNRCTYCDFYTQTDFSSKNDLLQAMKMELNRRSNYLKNQTISTIYFGGGTPSTMQIDEIKELLDAVNQYYNVSDYAEITLETNPDDLCEKYLKLLRKIGINRLSIGIQSFENEILAHIHRRHTAEQAINSVKQAQQYGFENISIDLIFGLPGETVASWKKQLRKGLELDVPHFSVYGLTYEKNTPLWKQWQKGKVMPIDDDMEVQMFDITRQTLQEAGYEHYEVSNFAKEGFQSRHNSNYWNGTPYLGIGPAAHSYDGISRRWNVASIRQYYQAVFADKTYFDQENLTLFDRINDRIMLSLRTAKGIDLKLFKTDFGEKYTEQLISDAKKIEVGKLKIDKEQIILTENGLLIADRIISELLRIDED